MTVTTKKRGKTNAKPSKTKSKVKEAPRVDEKALAAELERKYILESFYDTIGNVFVHFCLFKLGANLFLSFYVPGGRYAGSVGAGFWIISFVVCKFIMRYEGTKHAMYAKKRLQAFCEVLFLVHEALQVRNNSLASEESRKAHTAMIVLCLYFVASFMVRVCIPKCEKSPLWTVILMPLLTLKYPRLGIFIPRYEALAFGIAIGMGHAIGAAFDEMRWRHFISMHKLKLEHKREITRTNRRTMLLESLACGQESPFFDIIRR